MPRFSKHPISPRINPVEPPYDAETAAALEALGPPIALFRIFARSPERARGIHGWGRYYLSRQSALDLRHRELVIDRTTVRCGAEYEWGIHTAVFTAKAGLDTDQVRSIVTGDADDACWTDPADRAVLRAVDALCGTNDLTDDQWHDLADAIGDEASVDLLLLCGWYHAISFVARALRLPLEPDTPAFTDYRP
ncbi:carboxymuconolactone decarboxylase family protein [Actinomadura sp. 7K507]|uniref:carboxymuconolactone decarboxylase family protein n=1 Tax=Actinomadura sp. 7K507 TaxID=2530365 RepID=UPI001053E6AD|nr:carboxymuconolactone decarboxylase family protein [Actinomadura sp. 7K507]TDC87260.1 carboxymuconolactone decarboxylase family protein [Actinomadura sp. 7K507]